MKTLNEKLNKLSLPLPYIELMLKLNKAAQKMTQFSKSELNSEAEKLGLKKTDGFFLLTANKKLSKSLPKNAIHSNLLGLEILPAKLWYDTSSEKYSFQKKEVNVCPKAGECAKKNNCLVFSSPYSNAMKKRSLRKQIMFEAPSLFMKMLYHDIDLAFKLFEKPAFRFNVFSDILWEHVLPTQVRKMLSGNIYDYTKIKGRGPLLPKNFNYVLTYSFNEKDKVEDIPKLVKEYKSVAVVFPKGERPQTFQGIEVLNGDEHDYRIHDNHVVVGLTAKAGLSYKANADSKMVIKL